MWTRPLRGNGRSQGRRGAGLPPFKRDFARTPEPRGTRARRAREPIFVVQKHAAHRLRYDFRLELDGSLKSWAVPKQPSRDPKQKRLAVHVEDHPLDDASFEGVIPARAYGAGKGEIWDAGTWAAEGDPRKGYAEGKLSFTLKGRRLSGRWALVRMRSRAREGRRDNGLLIGSTLEFAPRGSTARSPSRGKKIS